MEAGRFVNEIQTSAATAGVRREASGSGGGRRAGGGSSSNNSERTELTVRQLRPAANWLARQDTVNEYWAGQALTPV